MFFLPMTQEQKDTLREKGIPFSVFSIDGESGGLFTEEHASALVALGLMLGTYSRTPYEGVLWAHTTPCDAIAAPPILHKSRVRKSNTSPTLIPTPERPMPAPVFPVTAYAWECADGITTEGKDLLLLDIQTILSPVVGKKIKVSAASGNGRDYISRPEGSVGLHLGEGLLTNTISIGSKLLGVRIQRNYRLLAPMEGGVVLTDDKGGGVAYAQIGPEEGQIWILLNLGMHGVMVDERTLFQKILREVAAEWILSPEQREERDRLCRLSRRPATKVAYTQACSKRVKAAQTQANNRIRQGEGTLRDLEAQIVALHRDLADTRRWLPQLEEQEKKGVEAYSAEFDKLLSIPHVLDVDIVGTRIRVFTDTLYCDDPRSKKRHELGKFRIEISLGDAPLVSWFNLTRQVVAFSGRKMQAPHVYPDGHACLGNMEEVFPSMIAAYEFSAAAQVAVAFLQQVNVEDQAGSYISRWPEASVKTDPVVPDELLTASPSVGEASAQELRAERAEAALLPLEEGVEVEWDEEEWVLESQG